MFTCLLAVLLVAVPLEVPWTGLSGSGLFTLPDTSTLANGRYTVGLAVDNRDRDPLGIDIFDGRVTGSFGLGRRTEVRGHYTFSRVVSMPEPPVPVQPPLDLIVEAGTSVPPRPYYSLYPEAPYLNHRGSARFGAFQSGDLQVGIKSRVMNPEGSRPGLALVLEMRSQVTRARRALESGASSGGTDVGLRGVAEWRLGKWALIGNAAFTRVGAPPDGDRIITAGVIAASSNDHALILSNRIDLGFGTRRELSRRLALVVETSLALTAGAHTALLDEIAPLDVIGGIQARLGATHLALGLRYHGNGARSGQTRPAPLAGYVDLSDVTEADTRSYLEGLNLGAAADQLRPGMHRAVLPSADGIPLPPGARIIPQTYSIRSEHQLGFVFMTGWSFGK